MPVRFAVAVHQIADYEHAHLLLFDHGLELTNPFDDYFLRTPLLYAPPKLLPPTRSWVCQATEYILANLGKANEYEYIQDQAISLAGNAHRWALKALISGRSVAEVEKLEKVEFNGPQCPTG